jgi:hypothetical protein
MCNKKILTKEINTLSINPIDIFLKAYYFDVCDECTQYLLSTYFDKEFKKY